VGDIELHRPGSQCFSTLTFGCRCLRCGGPVRWIAGQDPVGTTRWERQVVVQCVKDTCLWSGRVSVTLTDNGMEPMRGRAS
jgi:hypothetical protein